VINFSSLHLDKKIGEGAFADIHKARWRGMEVAVKKLHPEGENRARKVRIVIQ